MRELGVRENKRLTDGLFELILEADRTALLTKIGHFFTLTPINNQTFKLRDLALVRRVDTKDRSIHLIYNSDNLKRLKIGERVNIFGPLGKANKLEVLGRSNNNLIIAEGIGIGLIPLIKEGLDLVGLNYLILLRKAEIIDKDNLSFPKETTIFYDREELLQAVKKLRQEGRIDSYLILTEDELTNSLNQQLKGIRGYISLHNKLTKVCGTEACYGCIIQTKARRGYQDSFLRICIDGPIFLAEQLEGFNI